MAGARWGTFRILTWNIHKGVGGLDRRYRPERVAKVLDHYAPDLALLQEVAERMPRMQHHDQARLFSERLGMRHLAYHPEHQFRVGGYGNLILSRWPLSQIEHVDLTIGSRKKRGALKARVRIKVGRCHRSLVVYNMHLGLAGSERAKQLERFVAGAHFERMHGNTPLIVGGDLNDLWGTLGPRFLQPYGLHRIGKLQNTFPAALPMRPLDGLFFRGEMRLRHWLVSRIELATVASDHLPIVADIDIRGR